MIMQFIKMIGLIIFIWIVMNLLEAIKAGLGG